MMVIMLMTGRWFGVSGTRVDEVEVVRRCCAFLSCAVCTAAFSQTELLLRGQTGQTRQIGQTTYLEAEVLLSPRVEVPLAGEEDVLHLPVIRPPLLHCLCWAELLVLVGVRRLVKLCPMLRPL